MSQVEIYHNPRCSKSRQTLEILQQRGIEASIIEYLKQPPSREQIKAILKALDMTAHQLLRVKEAEYQEYKLSADTAEEDIISAMIAAPKLIERPIVIKAGKARIGRPPESVLEIL
ncbi:MAG: glutaredoxin family protein [Osedax symbiont Rs1]|nr:MAG: glutaredoxin family protein [Osedax symbiont Rs1]